VKGSTSTCQPKALGPYRIIVWLGESVRRYSLLPIGWIASSAEQNGLRFRLTNLVREFICGLPSIPRALRTCGEASARM